MFDAEKLLGKVMSEVSKSSKKRYKKNKKYKKDKYKKHSSKHSKSSDFVSSMAGKLMTGKGLMTALGLGVGAYAILKSNQPAAASPPQGVQATPTQTIPGPGAAPPPPPPPPGSTASSPPPPPAQEDIGSKSQTEDPSQKEASQALAMRMIQAMIAAAYADGQMDAEEEKEILARLRTEDLESEEKAYILNEFHNPKSIEELTEGIDNPQIAQAMYTVASSAVLIDTPEERAWLDRFAQALAISKEMQEFIEEG